ncbi:glycerate kinase, partial [Acidovorax cattleyae]|nr:glycerate kinase [Paracidovorax cattleyae]
MTFPDLPSAGSSLPAPDPATEPVRFLRHLYDVAVQAALPLQRMAAYLPPPPRGRTLVLGAGK